MGLLTFEDATGARWRVWHVETPTARAHLMDASFRNGWLVFQREDGGERRRLAQVPEDWAHLSPERLGRLCELAVPAPTAKPGSVVTTARMAAAPRPPGPPRDR